MRGKVTFGASSVKKEQINRFLRWKELMYTNDGRSHNVSLAVQMKINKSNYVVRWNTSKRRIPMASSGTGDNRKMPIFLPVRDGHFLESLTAFDEGKLRSFVKWRFPHAGQCGNGRFDSA